MSCHFDLTKGTLPQGLPKNVMPNRSSFLGG
jgi:hypothetical protein